MNNKEITKIALKIFSIYILVQALLAMPRFYASYMAYSSNWPGGQVWLPAIGAISIIALLIISVLIWKLSNKTCEQLNDIKPNQPVKTNEEFILSVLGLYLVAYGIYNIAITSLHTHFLIGLANEVTDKVALNYKFLVVYFIIAVLGVSLIIKVKGWLAFLKKIQTIGGVTKKV